MGEYEIVLDDEDWKPLMHSAIQHPSSQHNGSMVVIRDCLRNHEDDLSVFPPIHHENLHLPSSSSSSSSSSSCSSLWCTQTQHSPSPSPSCPTFLFELSDTADNAQLPSTPSDSMVPVVSDGVNAWWHVLRLKMLNIAYWFLGFKRGDSRGPFWSLYPAVGVAALVVWWWLCARVRRRRGKRESIDRLKLIIKEKDEKIMQLLNQIAQMNEVLLARHRVVTSKPYN